MDFGLFVCGSKKHNTVQLESITIRANIFGLLVHFEATFVYTNCTLDPIEVEFKYPLHSDSILVGIDAVIDGKVIKGIVKEKEEAKLVYEDAISSGETAVLVKEETKDIIGIALGNLAPGQKAEVKLQLVQQMEVEKQGIHLLLPATLKPRYSLTTQPKPPVNPSTLLGPFIPTPPPNIPPPNRLNIPRRPSCPPPKPLNVLPAIYTFGFELVVVSLIGELREISSPSHPLKEFISKDGQKGVHLTSPDPLNTDLVVYIDYEDIHPLTAMIEPAIPEREEKPAQHPFIDNPAVLLTFMPESSQAEVNTRGEYIFVIDQSGSMSGGSIHNAKETLNMLLRSLSPGSYFNIIGFGSHFRTLFPQSCQEYNQKSLEKAVKHVKRIDANLGGTEILAPLKHIYSKNPVGDQARQIFLLTDGGVSNTDEVVRIVADNAHNTRVFAFGIGSGVSTDLVTNVARAGKGKAVFISGQDRMQSRVMEVMNIAMLPISTDISVVGSKQMTVYPKSIPTLFENKPFVVVAFFTEKIVKGEKMSATLKYSSGQDTKVNTAEFSLSDSVSALSPHLPPQLVHQFGVSKALRDLESAMSSKDECVTLSCYANVLSKHTAFVTVTEDQERVVGSAMKVYRLKITNVLRISPIKHGNLMSDIKSMCSFPKGCIESGTGPQLFEMLRCNKTTRSSAVMDESMSSDEYESDLDDDWGVGPNILPVNRSARGQRKLSASPPNINEIITKQPAAPPKRAPVHLKRGPINSLPELPTTSFLNEPGSTRHQEFMKLPPAFPKLPESPTKLDRVSPIQPPPVPKRASRGTDLPRPPPEPSRPPPEPSRPPPERSRIPPELRAATFLPKPVPCRMGAAPPKLPSTPFPPEPGSKGHLGIMTLQKADGNWEYSEEIEKLLSCKDLKNSCPKEVSNLQIWLTLLCIACLQVRFQEFRSEWLLVSKKGERWVLSQFGSMSGKSSYFQLLKLATDLIRK